MVKNLFSDNIINESAIKNMKPEQLKAVAQILRPLQNAHIFTVKDGQHAVKVYREYNGFITCDNMPEYIDGRLNQGLTYWDYYTDIIAFVCEHNPQIDPAAAWIEDTDGRELYDEDE